MIVVLPVCKKDLHSALRNLSWLQQLNPVRQSFRCIVSHELGLGGAGSVVEAARRCFAEVSEFTYALYSGRPAWPHPQNYAFRLLAINMAKSTRESWLWWEQDAVILSPTAFQDISDEYEARKYPFMGAHGALAGPERQNFLNGVAVYPADAVRRSVRFMAPGNTPFDVAGGKVVLGQSYITPLFQNVWSFDGTPQGLPPTFTDQQSLFRIKPEAVIFHRCKDETLVQRLSEVRNTQLEEESKQPSIQVLVDQNRRQNEFYSKVRSNTVVSIMHNEGDIIDEPSTSKLKLFYHSGNLGDVTYALYAISKLGPCKLLIGPNQYKTSSAGQPINEAQFNRLKPLLMEQPYIESCEFREHYPGDAFDLNAFRNLWHNQLVRRSTGINTLAQMHFFLLGINNQFSFTEPWLNITSPLKSNAIVFHRSPRYRSDNFPWKLALEWAGKRALFVGLREEHKDFVKNYGKIKYYKSDNFLELARVIAGAEGFIGNQSFPCSIAIGCGRRVIQEAWPPSPDCTFNRPNFYSQLFCAIDKSLLDSWIDSTQPIDVIFT